MMATAGPIRLAAVEDAGGTVAKASDRKPVASEPSERLVEAASPTLLDGVSPRNALNDLTAREWISESVSVWSQRGLGAGHDEARIERLHPAPFSFTDVARLVRLFTKRGMTVLDPFAGVGSTLKACALEGRNGIGIELYPDFVQLIQQRLVTEVPPELLGRNLQTVYEGDARVISEKLEQESVDFIVTSPPYWSILNKRPDHKVKATRVADGLALNYGDDSRDLSNIKSYDDFIGELADTLAACGSALRTGRYMAMIVGDFRHGKRFHMFHADIANELQQRGYVLSAVNVLHQRHKRVFPYGYPAAYVPNVHHQHIVILRKEPST
jgi:DNA modification methylase